MKIYWQQVQSAGLICFMNSLSLEERGNNY